MRIEIKGYSSPDILDFKNFEPNSKESFSFLLELEIGMKEKAGSDLFSVEVCTPKWLLENYQSYDVLLGRHKVIVFEYNIDNIISALGHHINSIACNSWEDFAKHLSRIAHWEFDDYKG